ncbi:MAG: 2-hydroxyacid dehydrogenase [Paracoccaceae bacterium]|nr:2-hydroxyacid dehydrogenase [Paracoccaceae bacterium]
MAELLLIGDVTDTMRVRLAAKFTIHELADMTDPLAWLKEHGAKIQYVSTNGHDGIRPEYVEAMPDLKLISCYGVGYDAIDTAQAVSRGIWVTHTPNVLNAEVATTALMLMLACYRNLLADDAYVRSGKWQTDGNAPLTRTADNRTVGIVGLGRIGQAIADKLAPFNAKILYHARNEKSVDYTYYSDLTAMARDSEVLICITPGGPSTHKLVNADVIKALGPEGILINVSRGSVVDEAALIAALQEQRLGAAGLDVFEHEPKVPTALRALSNVVLLPHVGSATHETRAAMGALTVDNLLQHFEQGTVISPVPECAKM